MMLFLDSIVRGKLVRWKEKLGLLNKSSFVVVAVAAVDVHFLFSCFVLFRFFVLTWINALNGWVYVFVAFFASLNWWTQTFTINMNYIITILHGIWHRNVMQQLSCTKQKCQAQRNGSMAANQNNRNQIVLLSAQIPTLECLYLNRFEWFLSYLLN